MVKVQGRRLVSDKEHTGHANHEDPSRPQLLGREYDFVFVLRRRETIASPQTCGKRLGKGTPNNDHIMRIRIDLNRATEISPYVGPRPNPDHPAQTLS